MTISNCNAEISLAARYGIALGSCSSTANFIVETSLPNDHRAIKLLLLCHALIGLKFSRSLDTTVA